MAFPLKFRAGKRFLRWSGGGALAVVSIGMHGLLLGMPMPGSAPEANDDLTELSDPAAVMDVVRLPASSKSIAEGGALAPVPATPAAQASQPARSPVASAPAAPAPAAPVPATPPPAKPQTAPPPQAAPASPPDVSTLQPLPAEPPPPTLDDRLRDPAQYQFNQQAKSLSTDDVNFHLAVVPHWLETESQGLSDSQVPILGQKLAPLQVPYALSTCLVPPPAEGLVGVIVSATGELVKEPVLLDSTGYTVLDEKALELTLQRTFEPQSGALPNPQAHWLPVQVQYDGVNCTP
ncbi:hypothetical protein IQ265_03700 [Nodosilinea sp. LEGE 06152]|uniref:hypothetical protein n=1 Tax=Nodosilinea sp. LEGE 06152 TaxID=2777966 RepID=UPI00188111EA|nr:hypothetical protein [Nodosilinea sp. LEGE 06152]MBE9155939.1 hypothetical protein [Nodosilinea sp. LEGE 06152]